MLIMFAKKTLFCKSCDSMFNLKNKPCILNCGNTVCQNCVNTYTKVIFDHTNSSYQFEKNHTHIFEDISINYSYLDLIQSIIVHILRNNPDLKECNIEKFLRPNKEKVINHECSFIKELDLLKDKMFNGGIKTQQFEYKGEIFKGLMHGKGKYICSNFVFDGQFNKDSPNGKGILKFDNNIKKFVIEGEFLGKFDFGFAQITYSDGSVYTGNYKNFEKNGLGILTLNNGDYYEGEFTNDLKNGQGIYYYLNENKKYVGQWKNDMMEGEFSVFFNTASNGIKVIFKNDKLDTILSN